jgi:hypothetical protein
VGCDSLAATDNRHQQHFTAPTERTPSSKDFEAGINLTIE